MINDCSDRISVMVLLISARTWTCRKTVPLQICNSCVVRIMPRSSWMNHRLITHLLFENTRVKFPEIAGRQCCPLHFTGHLEAQTCDCVIIPYGASQGILLHSSHTKRLKNLTSRDTLLTLQMLRKESYRLCHRLIYSRSWEWWSKSRSTQQLRRVLYSYVVKCVTRHNSAAIVWGIACSTSVNIFAENNKRLWLPCTLLSVMCQFLHNYASRHQWQPSIFFSARFTTCLLMVTSWHLGRSTKVLLNGRMINE
jgi:hypothetical protein